jgi:putative transposase
LQTKARKGWGPVIWAPWKTKEAVELATLEWVSWFNHHRLLERIGYIPPAEAEANYYRQLASQASTVGA